MTVPDVHVRVADDTDGAQLLRTQTSQTLTRQAVRPWHQSAGGSFLHGWHLPRATFGGVSPDQWASAVVFGARVVERHEQRLRLSPRDLTAKIIREHLPCPAAVRRLITESLQNMGLPDTRESKECTGLANKQEWF